mmetsp:Transcript_30499/g.81213  ORF Transcript_30499/g.81213 Transcript_30499/m.81213 type:complete len:87 (-) Transcript_30499:2-262(-)
MDKVVRCLRQSRSVEILEYVWESTSESTSSSDTETETASSDMWELHVTLPQPSRLERELLHVCHLWCSWTLDVLFCQSSLWLHCIR